MTSRNVGTRIAWWPVHKRSRVRQIGRMEHAFRPAGLKDSRERPARLTDILDYLEKGLLSSLPSPLCFSLPLPVSSSRPYVGDVAGVVLVAVAVIVAPVIIRALATAPAPAYALAPAPVPAPGCALAPAPEPASDPSPAPARESRA